MGNDNYIRSLVTPTTRKPQGRKVWSVDLEQVWLPFFTATNAMGDTAIPSEAIGAPLRLGYDKAGQVRFSQAGRPIIKVAKELSEAVRTVRENLTANLLSYAGSVIAEHPEEYKAQIALAQEAGEPIANHDKTMLSQALKDRAELEAEAIAEAKAHSQEAELVTA